MQTETSLVLDLLSRLSRNGTKQSGLLAAEWGKKRLKLEFLQDRQGKVWFFQLRCKRLKNSLAHLWAEREDLAQRLAKIDDTARAAILNHDDTVDAFLDTVDEELHRLRRGKTVYGALHIYGPKKTWGQLCDLLDRIDDI